MFAEFDKILRSSTRDVNWSEVGVFSATQVLERFELSDWDSLRLNLLITQKDWRVLCIEALSAFGSPPALDFLFYILCHNNGDTVQECLEAIGVNRAGFAGDPNL
ncbi:hypothetical protein ACCS33_00190 [Rhizobium ruizarguesonis]|uniref:hypothetical protein n=1 Tax=Rhizobium ruizarguesonis TaxID=2081791 RepID=UPI001030791A|nr:hypothetical protein [Rhizobium ruizarguesonis]TBB59756.1 hypothetical protein ELH42_28290 [Rhizobium ruizarguesonis]